MFKRICSALFVMVISAVTVTANATTTPVDLTPLTSAVDYSAVITAILAIAALLMAVYVSISGVKFVIGMVRRA